MPDASATPPALFTRHEHGGCEVRLIPVGDQTRYEVRWPDGPRTYPSARSMLRAIYSGGDGSLCARDPGVSFERYFRLGLPEPRGGFSDLFMPQLRHATTQARAPAGPKARSTRGLTVAKAPAGPGRSLRSRAKLVVEAPWWDGPVIVGGTVRPLPDGAWARGGLTISKPKRAPRRAPAGLTVEKPVAPAPPGPVLGIDLEGRGHEVRKLFHSCFGARVTRLGYDHEDVLQEVYRGLLARNRGTCPWDARKSSWGHYVYMVIECVLRNFTRKQRRIAEHEQVGAYMLMDGEWNQVDAAIVAQEGPSSWEGIEDAAAEEMVLSTLSDHLMESGEPEAVIAVLALPHVSAGCSRQMISERISREIGEVVKPAEVGRALTMLRRETRAWVEGQGLR